MSSTGEWAKGYARQAHADFETWDKLQDHESIPQCHKLMFLQMACEYPWEDERGQLHVPLDWTFTPSHLLTAGAGRTFLKLVHEAIFRFL